MIVVMGIVGTVVVLLVRVFLARISDKGVLTTEKKGLELPVTGSRKVMHDIERLAGHGPRSSSHVAPYPGWDRNGEGPGLRDDRRCQARWTSCGDRKSVV